MIQRTKIDVSEETRILAYMITSSEFLKSIRPICDTRYFQSQYVSIIARWVIEFYEHTETAPMKAIEDVYLRKVNTVRSEDDKENIANFLTHLSENYEKSEITNVRYAIQSATEYFKVRSLDVLKQNLEKAVQSGDYEYGEKMVQQYSKVEHIGKRGVDILTDTAAIERAFTREYNGMFSMPGALGRVWGEFERGDFIAIAAPAKRGKSYELMNIGLHGMRLGYKVYFASLEMTEDMMLRRAWKSITGNPVKASTIELPYFLNDDDEKETEVGKRSVEKESALDKIEKIQSLHRKHSRTGDFKLEIFPERTLSPQGLESTIEMLDFYEGYMTDIVIVDYADLMGYDSTYGKMEYRHTLDSIWRGLRRIAQKYNCLVVTASQTGRATQGGKKDIEQGDMSEDSRKLAHVTKAIALNQNEAEKADGIMRVKNLVRREHDEGLSLLDECVVLQALHIARPYIDSRPRALVDLEAYKNE